MAQPYQVSHRRTEGTLKVTRQELETIAKSAGLPANDRTWGERETQEFINAVHRERERQQVELLKQTLRGKKHEHR